MDEEDRQHASEALGWIAALLATGAMISICMGVEISFVGEAGFSPVGPLLGLAILGYGLSAWWTSPFSAPLYGDEGVHANATGPFVMLLGLGVLVVSICL